MAEGHPQSVRVSCTLMLLFGCALVRSYGNANGYSRDDDDGISCGSLGYARTDAEFADKVIIITNNIVSYPNAPWAIPEHDVDYVVRVDDIGDPKGIMSGATRYTKIPRSC